MLPLDFLGVSFAWAVHVGVQMPGVCAPMISVVAGEPKGLLLIVTINGFMSTFGDS
jgi:hypothetical protein